MRQTLTQLANNTRGSMAIIYAVSFLSIMTVVAGAIDFNQRESVERHVQLAADAAVLGAMRARIEANGDSVDLQAIAKSIFAENIKTMSHTAQIVPTVTTDANTVKVTVSYEMPTTMLSVAQIPTLPVRASATAAYGAAGPLEAVMVLDLSSSMVGAPLDDLKSAASRFVDSVLTDGDDKARIAIVPFSNMVKVGMPYRHASWAAIPSDYSETHEVCTVNDADAIAAGCVKQTEPASCSTDGVAYACSRTVWTCSDGAAAPANNCNDVTKNYAWYGCVSSREVPYDIEDRSFSTKKVPGDMSTSDWGCNSEILPLTSSRSDIDDAIDALTAEGETYLATGVVWGQRVLSSVAPFSEGEDETTFAARSGQKVMIIMSDGANTRSANPAGGSHWLKTLSDADARTRAACEEAQDAGTRIFAIAFNVTSSSTLDILEDCAENDPTRFFEVTNTTGLESAFGTIGSNFSGIRLVH